MKYLVRYLWDCLKGTIWGRLVATVIITAAMVTIAWYKQQGNRFDYRFLGGFVALATAGELYLEFMSYRRRRTTDEHLKLTWVDLLVMMCLFAVLVTMAGVLVVW